MPPATGPACADPTYPPGTWDTALPGEGTRARRRRVATATAVCAHCPLRAPCGQLADTRRDIGIWGGTLRPWNPAHIPAITWAADTA